MAMDALEKEHLRRQMATDIRVFLGTTNQATCVSSHWYDRDHKCELCQRVHTQSIFVIKNRAGKKMRVALSCLKEMVRFKVIEVEDFARWESKLPELKVEAQRRQKEQEEQRQEERKRLERRVIVRRRKPEPLTKKEEDFNHSN